MLEPAVEGDETARSLGAARSEIAALSPIAAVSKAALLGFSLEDGSGYRLTSKHTTYFGYPTRQGAAIPTGHDIGSKDITAV